MHLRELKGYNRDFEMECDDTILYHEKISVTSKIITEFHFTEMQLF